ncbi:VWA domain-containing protein [Bacillus aerolatus]|uniref:VWA domain-containing protein n=1 Tax=Bacillus aerolatus TaxID=2653354 RepID=A0A6I1FJS2_9BACI|nr:VWA domain-containing protein [Bacillus aerolatus]KAB7706249.1 VWA domain-containing protein [Bacillus aerolatus]
MKRFIQFNDETIDSFLFMQLSDLAKTLTKEPEVEVEYSPYAYVNKQENKIYVSHFWNHRPAGDTWDGFKSDIFLRALGSWKHTDEQAIRAFLQQIERSPILTFAKQLVVMAEDIRLEEICKKDRPGTKKAFAARRRMYRQYFTTQLNVNLVKSLSADALFNLQFILLHADSPVDPPFINQEIEAAMPFLQRSIMEFYDARSTADVIKISETMVEIMEEILNHDLLNQYFHLPELSAYENMEGDNFHDLKRKDPLANDDRLEEEKSGEEEILDEEFRTWHRETSELGSSFLQFDLDQGSKTELMGEGVREGEAGDQALAMVQGSAQETSRKDFANLPAENLKKEVQGGGQAVFGKENRFAVPCFKKAEPADPEAINKYKKQKAQIASLQKKLKNMIEKTLEHKKIQPRGDLHRGRLNKKLIRFFIEDQPRLFYKKQEPSTEIDATFTLLVDCSASMQDKMEQTKLGIVLFHEALKSVRVPHEVIGFWEDTSGASDTMQPNYFHTVIDYEASLQSASGPEVMQLEPEEDNRDGFAIRVVTERIKRRSEKQKFLLVFSDGEPAAYDYDRNGIIDTHEAVLEARKLGIEVINVFLADGEIAEAQQKTIQNIYGKYSIFVTDINELPHVIFPLLKKLLYKSF